MRDGGGAAHLAQVVFGAFDPKTGAAGSVFDLLADPPQPPGAGRAGCWARIGRDAQRLVPRRGRSKAASGGGSPRTRSYQAPRGRRRYHARTARNPSSHARSRQRSPDLDRPRDDRAGRIATPSIGRDRGHRCPASTCWRKDQKARHRPAVAGARGDGQWNRTTTRARGCGAGCWREGVPITWSRGADPRVPARLGADQHLADVRQFDLPGPPFPAPAVPALKHFHYRNLDVSTIRNSRGAGRLVISQLQGRRPPPRSVTCAIPSRNCAITAGARGPSRVCRAAEDTEGGTDAGGIGSPGNLTAHGRNVPLYCCWPAAHARRFAFAQAGPGRAGRQTPLAALCFRKATTDPRARLPLNQVNAILQTPTATTVVRHVGRPGALQRLEFHVFDRRNTPA